MKKCFRLSFHEFTKMVHLADVMDDPWSPNAAEASLGAGCALTGGPPPAHTAPSAG